jgi:DNA-binding transcriptional regulator YiaG
MDSTRACGPIIDYATNAARGQMGGEKVASIRELRQTLKVSQSALATRAGTSRFRVSFIENKYVDPSPEEDTALRKALLELMQERSLSFYGQMQHAPQET